MKKLAAITLTSMMLLLATAMVVGAVDSVEIRGQVATGNFEWTVNNFAGFYYDIDDNLGTETLTTTITEGNKLQEPNGITYTTTAQKNDFDFEDWGYYNVIGFQANQYFAGYLNDENVPDENEILFRESEDENSLSDEQLEAILMDDDTEMTVTSGTPLKLEEGYELSIKSIDIDGNKVYLELTKDGSVVDSKVISPSKDNPTMADKTYYYKKDVGDSKDLVIIAAHFKNAFRGADQNLATIDGIWQISEVPTEVKVDTEYDKMRIATVTSDTITMDNKDNTVTLSKNKDISLMGDVKIITSDQDVVDDANPLRYYIAKVVTEPGTYELRGAVADGDFTWNAQNFAGFYYDIDDDLGTETLTTTITEGNKLQEPNGITYTTTAQKNDFDFEDWGYYNVIGFQANQYFAGYLNDENVPDENEILFRESEDENSLSDEQLEAILMDDDTEMTVTSGTPLKLEEGYELSIKSIDIDGNKVYLELTKDGSVVDSKVISPSKDNPTMADKTYYYKKDVGDSKDLVIIAAHFKNAFRGADQNLATIDGIWQISEVPTEVKADTEYDKMRIATVTSDTITMDNKDNTVTLSKNKDISLMGDVKIKTSDQDVVDDANPLRYYLYKEVTLEGAEAAEQPAPVEPAKAEVTEEAAPVEEAAPAPVTVAENKTTEAAPAAAEEKKNETAEPAKTEPGFESIFAITGLLAVAYLVLGRRE
ncbi:MAG TPA: S-layer protein domain-containing protein [Methanothrix sp.]|nr:S-layer protein domain-containing protein [Methanothrix sp.]HQE87970.1 S-layer protein domain-containing protein [Methanothrix sp.]